MGPKLIYLEIQFLSGFSRPVGSVLQVNIRHIIPARTRLWAFQTSGYINISAQINLMFHIGPQLCFYKGVASGSYRRCKTACRCRAQMTIGDSIYEKTETRHERQSI